MSEIFVIVEAILKAIKLWDGFMNYMDTKHRADLQAVAQARDKAIDDSKKADTDDEIWKSQDGITHNQPKP